MVLNPIRPWFETSLASLWSQTIECTVLESPTPQDTQFLKTHTCRFKRNWQPTVLSLALLLKPTSKLFHTQEEMNTLNQMVKVYKPGPGPMWMRKLTTSCHISKARQTKSNNKHITTMQLHNAKKLLSSANAKQTHIRFSTWSEPLSEPQKTHRKP